MKRVFIYIFSLLLVTSCATCRNCRNGVLNSVDCKDSVVIRETIVYRDTLIPVPVKDSTSKAWLERDSLKLTISNKPSPVPPVKATISEKARTETKTLVRTEVKTVEINQLTKWQKVMISLGYVFIGICAGVLLYIFYRITRPRI